ncbi:MAG: Asp23/Gls24 family envelope stress response protein [Methylocystaceae bacterium]
MEGKLDMEKAATNNEYGAIKIADEVVSVIAGLAASEVDGVAAMSGGWGANLGEMLGKKNLAKGVKVEVDGESVTIEAFVVIQFGFPIPRVAAGVQQSVKQAVESMTGLNVSAVNVHVSGVLMKKPVEAGEEVEV